MGTIPWKEAENRKEKKMLCHQNGQILHVAIFSFSLLAAKSFLFNVTLLLFIRYKGIFKNAPSPFDYNLSPILS